MKERTYIAIDLKSFYASVECVERSLDPLAANLVVADLSRTEKTICLAVSPSLKSYGIPGRARLFEVIEKVKAVNAARQRLAPGRQFAGKSVYAQELADDPALELDYIVAPPRMAKYMEYSTRIVSIYERFVSPQDIHVYSIDEVFIDATRYLGLLNLSAREFAMQLIRAVLHETGITATAGIGTNLYLAKIAMDIVAKKMPPDSDGVRIAELDERGYREQLWSHRPLTDFWRVGKGYSANLEAQGLLTMGDVARCSIGGPNDYYNEALLYRMFGVNAELLIDHAWGWEPCTIDDIKAYRPSANSLSIGQVLQAPYTFDKAKIIVREMTEQLTLDMVAKNLKTDQIELTIGYDTESLTRPEIRSGYHGEVKTDFYGRNIPKHAHGTSKLSGYTVSGKEIMQAMLSVYDRTVNPELLIRRVNVVALHVLPESKVPKTDGFEQLDMFTDYAAQEAERAKAAEAQAKEAELQRTVVRLKDKYGKNAILKGTNFEDGATAQQRNQQIGGHKA